MSPDSERRVRVRLLRSGQALLDIERRTTRPRRTVRRYRTIASCPATGLRRFWQTNVALQQTHCMLHPAKHTVTPQTRFGALPHRCALSKYQVAKLEEVRLDENGPTAAEPRNSLAT